MKWTNVSKKALKEYDDDDPTGVCEFCIFRIIDEGTGYKGCSHPDVVEEHRICCKDRSTGSSIDAYHAREVHCSGHLHKYYMNKNPTEVPEKTEICPICQKPIAKGDKTAFPLGTKWYHPVCYWYYSLRKRERRRIPDVFYRFL